MTLELIAIIASSSVIVAVAPILIKHWQEASFLRKNKYERINETSNALLTSLLKLIDQQGEENQQDEKSKYADVLTNYISWDSVIRPLTHKDNQRQLNEIESFFILDNLGSYQLTFALRESGQDRIYDIRELTKICSKQSRFPMLLVYISIGVISGLISAILLLYWAGYTWHY